MGQVASKASHPEGTTDREEDVAQDHVPLSRMPEEWNFWVFSWYLNLPPISFSDDPKTGRPPPTPSLEPARSDQQELCLNPPRISGQEWTATQRT